MTAGQAATVRGAATLLDIRLADASAKLSPALSAQLGPCLRFRVRLSESIELSKLERA